MSNVFNKGKDTTITTGVQGSVATDLQRLAAQADEVEAPNMQEPIVEGNGYLSYQASYVMVGDKKVLGISTDRGFFYPSSLDKAVLDELKSLAKRGFAYELNPAAK